MTRSTPLATPLFLSLLIAVSAIAQSPAPVVAMVAIKGGTIHTMAGPDITDGVILIKDGKIEKIGPAAEVTIPDGAKVMTAKVVTPGLIDARTIVGLQGFRNEPREQDQLEKSAPVQPELRAYDAFNGREKLLDYLRGYGITTIHSAPQPGALVPGQSMLIKTRGPTADDGLLSQSAMLCITLGETGMNEERGKAPGTRPKQIAMLRAEFVKAGEYEKKKATAAAKAATRPGEDSFARNLSTEVFVRALKRELPVLITAHRAQDILLAIKLAQEFKLKLILDGASEIYDLLPQVKAAGCPVILHPTMYRSSGQYENLSMETAAKLQAAGIPFALQSSYEGYVPKTRVVLFEAAVAAANGLTQQQALACVTINAAKILGVEKRVGSLEAGKDADIALYDGDPFEYTSHCVGTIIEGMVVSEGAK